MRGSLCTLNLGELIAVASDDWRNTALDGKRVILVCDHGYSSVLAAAMPVTVARRHDGLPGQGPPD